MEEIKVGEYVRSSNGYISKIIKRIESKRDCDTYFVTDTTMASGFYAQIINHSPNIIDLIEAGDYVNGYKVLEVCSERGWIDVDCNKQSEECTIWEDDIKSIVTKEQFASMEYRLED